MVGEPDAHAPPGRRRQGSPAAVGFRVAPGDPCRGPHRAGNPAPAEARAQEPAPVVEGRPTPGVKRLPVPARVGVNPPAAVAIRPPGWIHHRASGPPAPAVVVHVNPRPVRRERGVKVVVHHCGRPLGGACRHSSLTGGRRGFSARRGHRRSVHRRRRILGLAYGGGRSGVGLLGLGLSLRLLLRRGRLS